MKNRIHTSIVFPIFEFFLAAKSSAKPENNFFYTLHIRKTREGSVGKKRTPIYEIRSQFFFSQFGDLCVLLFFPSATRKENFNTRLISKLQFAIMYPPYNTDHRQRSRPCFTLFSSFYFYLLLHIFPFFFFFFHFIYIVTFVIRK